MNPSWQLRAAQRDDALCLAALARQVFVHTYASAGISPLVAQYLEQTFSVPALQQVLTDRQRRCHVVTAGERYLGLAQTALGVTQPLLPAGAAAELERLYVLPAMARQGLGSALLRAAQASAKASGCGLLWLTCWSHNESALKFYQATGFADWGPAVFQMGSESVPNRVLAQSIH